MSDPADDRKHPDATVSSDPGLEWPDGPPPDDPAEGLPGNFADVEPDQLDDPGLEIPDGPPPPDPSRGNRNAP